MSGPLALVGGFAFAEGCSFDGPLLDEVGATEVVVLPTAAAYERPEKRIAAATTWFEGLGRSVKALPVYRRDDAADVACVDAVRQAKAVYLTGGSPLHLRSVLKSTPLWEAIEEAWHAGALLAGSSAGAMVLTDPMVDPRGGAFTLGLGLVTQLAFVPHADAVPPEQLRRTIRIADAKLPVVAVDDRTALIRTADGTWRAEGAGQVRVWCDGAECALDALPT